MELKEILQEGKPLPGPESGLLSNTRGIVQRDACAGDFIGQGHRSREREGKGTQENCSTVGLTASAFMVTGLVSRFSLTSHSDSGSFLVAHALLSQMGASKKDSGWWSDVGRLLLTFPELFRLVEAR